MREIRKQIISLYIDKLTKAQMVSNTTHIISDCNNLCIIIQKALINVTTSEQQILRTYLLNSENIHAGTQ